MHLKSMKGIKNKILSIVHWHPQHYLLYLPIHIIIKIIKIQREQRNHSNHQIETMQFKDHMGRIKCIKIV